MSEDEAVKAAMADLATASNCSEFFYKTIENFGEAADKFDWETCSQLRDVAQVALEAYLDAVTAAYKRFEIEGKT